VIAKRLDEEHVARFLTRACDRHGGLDAFRRLTKLELRVTGLRGAIPWLKGLGRTFPHPGDVDVWPHRERAVFLDYPERGDAGVYQAGRVAIGTTDLEPGDTHYRRTLDRIAWWRPWTPLDALYFFGYSLLDYVSLPFTLLDRVPIDARQRRDRIELWYRFPSGADTHSTIQGFYFDESGLLLRHDYRADVLGRMFNGAHLHREHRQIGGILLATHRTVYAKPGHYPVRARLPIPVLEAWVVARHS
jgi:hypothetical protein